ncbi:glycosyltransferase family 61 protein [Rhodovarius crocodyli]|uniref:Glycosyltransferase family 61 protein n=2 Tax=Rhodovarius crocodyli TaxID=1979269 RepID=A0A437MCS9_9PROT|nr:glycosyltransferase family 61 protein [Rhodovarius crocodyli]
MPHDMPTAGSAPRHPGSSDEALSLAIAHGGHRNILVLAHDFPPACNQPGLHVTYLGPIGRLPALRCASAALYDCPDPAQAPELMRRLAGETTRRHSLAFIDSDHRAAALVAQIAAMAPLCEEDAWWAFDDAVPPRPEMATAEPRAGWWVGQVYALPKLMDPVAGDAAAAVMPLPPTGISFFRGWRLPEADVLAARLADLPEEPGLEAISRLSALPGASALDLFLGMPGTALPQNGPLDVLGEAGRMVIEELEPETPAAEPIAPLGIVQAGGTADTSACEAPPGPRHGSALVEYRDVVVSGFDALFFGNTLTGRYRDPAQRLDHAGRLAATGAWGYDRSWPVLRDAAGGLHVNPAALTPAGDITESVLWGTPDKGADWGIWLLTAFASVELFHNHRDRFAKFFCWCPMPWQKDFLAAAGLAAEDVLFHQAEKPWLLRHVGLLEQSRRDLALTPFLRGALDRFLERQGLFDLPAGDRRLFVSRLSVGRRGAYRALEDEEALQEAMRQRGFEILYPESLSLPEQARHFREASVVVGPGGGGLFNAVFCRPGTSVILLEGKPGRAAGPLNLFASAGLPAGLVLGEELPGAERRWRLDLDKALAGLDAMLRG